MTSFPCLPVISLSDAEESTTHEIVKGTTTIIDFWTTRCTRCPNALDKLNELAQARRQINDDTVRFISICCDSLDGAREIINHWDNVDDEPRWTAIDHFFMEQSDKEEAKRILGFTAVPFYVILDEEGNIVQKGNKVDLSALPFSNQQQTTEEEPEKTITTTTTPIKPTLSRAETPATVAIQEDLESEGSFQPEERTFELEDLDF